MTAPDHLEAGIRDRAVFIRRSTAADIADLARLAALNGTGKTPRGVYLIAEVEGKIVAAASLQRAEPLLHDPSYASSDVQELVRRWSRKVRGDVETIKRHAA
jgi:hypothetical protein